jgi:hypothetical protein
VLALAKEKFKESNEGEFDEIYFLQNNHNYVLSRVRRIAPAPHVLVARFDEVVNFFTSVKDSNGVPLFNAEVHKQIDELRKHILKGCLSDPPNVQLYYPAGLDRDNLQLWMCSRGSVKNETSHTHLKDIIVSFGTGPELVDAVCCNDQYRTAIKSLIRYSPGFKDIGHFDHFYLDLLQIRTMELFGTPRFEWWPNSNQLYSPEESYGICPIRPGQPVFCDDDVKHLPRKLRFVAKQQREKIPYLPIIYPEERKEFKKLLIRSEFKKGKTIFIQSMI